MNSQYRPFLLWALRRLVIIIIFSLANAPSFGGPIEDKALLDAAGCGDNYDIFDPFDVEGLKEALKLGGDPNAQTKTVRKLTPLGCISMQLAGRHDESLSLKAIDAANSLFAAGARLGPADQDILYSPIANGYIDMVRLLVEHGASPMTELEGYTPAELALYHNQVSIYDYLVRRGATPIDDKAAATLRLLGAAADTNLEAMHMALEDGADINGKGPDGRTPLIEAVRNFIYGLPESYAIEWLLDHGADPNMEGASGFSNLEGIPIHIFVSTGSLVIRRPLRGRPDVTWMVEERLLQLLMAGARVSAMDSMRRTPLHLAAEYDAVPLAEILIQEGARVMARDVNGRTPLDYAESAQMIRLLKAAGAIEQ